MTVAGRVLVRQLPGTAKGAIFLTQEISNIIYWKQTYQRFRYAVIAWQ